MNKINITEYCNTHDAYEKDSVGLKGIIEISNDMGTIVRTHNMIVDEGRKVILGKFLDNDNYKSYDLAYIVFASEDNPKMTEKSDKISTYNPMDTNNTNNIRIELDDASKLTPDYGDLSIRISVKMTPNDESFKKINSIMTVLFNKDKSNPQYKLFSRALIDPIFIGPDMSYDLTYTFYF